MKQNSRTLVIFFILVVIILVSGMAISLYLLSQETSIRKSTEIALEETRQKNMKVEAAFKEAQKQIEVLTGKNKDADEKINSLMEEIDLETALREEMKAENKKLKDNLEAEAKAKLDLKQKLTADLEAVQAKLAQAETELGQHKEKAAGFEQKVAELQKKNDELEMKLKDVDSGEPVPPSRSEILPMPDEAVKDKVELDRIVVTPEGSQEGRVLNVDTETEFLIFDLGSKNGIKVADVMSVYRGKAYLGDVKVSRVQEEMSAADLIPPFSSKKVRKNDQVVAKR